MFANQTMTTNTPIEKVNYTYLVGCIILLLITYYMLRKTKTYIHNKELHDADIERKTVHVKTQKGDIYMDSNVFEMHMNRIKKNIIELNKNLTTLDCVNIKEYLDRAKINTKKYIDINYDNADSKFCDLSTQLNIVDDNILQEREMLKKRIVNKTETETDGDNEIDKLRYSILELITDMDIIIFLIRTSMCKNGKFDLTMMDRLLLELYKTNCTNSDNFSPNYIENTPESTSIFQDNSLKEDFNHIEIMSRNHVDVSQKMPYHSSTAVLRNRAPHKFKDEHTVKFNRDVVSHSPYKDFKPNITSLNITESHTKKYGHQKKLKTYDDYMMMDPRNKEIDMGSRQSLFDVSR